MSLRDQLLTLRSAARSFAKTEDPEGTLLLLRKEPYGQFFFGELSDPQWLPHLKKRGFFDELPGPQLDGETTKYPYHKPFLALKRVATSAPGLVTEILESLTLNDNPAIGEQILQVISAIKDGEYVERLMWTVERVVESKLASDWLWFDEILTNWITLKKWEACLLVLANALKSSVRISREGGGDRFQWQVTEIDRKVLAPIAVKQPLEVARLLVNVLTAWAETERQARREAGSADSFDVGPNYNFPDTYWFDDVDSEMYGAREVQSRLTSRLLAVGEQVMTSSKLETIRSFDALLRQDRWHLFRRIRWTMYGHVSSFTLAAARREVLERIPYLGLARSLHRDEFRRMLEVHAVNHEVRFLKQKEIALFFDSVMSGPIEPGGDRASGVDVEWFHRFQLQPIRSLLKGRAFNEYARITKNADNVLEGPSRGRFVGGAVQEISPPEAENLDKMSDAMLWYFLNTWTPDPRSRWTGDFLKEPTVAALSDKFAKMVEANSERFAWGTQWWMNLTRPEILRKVLERATQHVITKEPISNDQWKSFFGIASQIVALTTEPILSTDSDREMGHDWLRIVVVKFLSATITAGPPPTKDQRDRVGAMLRQLFEGQDRMLAARENPSMSDWLTTGINSVRGTAFEGLLDLALEAKKNSDWNEAAQGTFEFLVARLEREEESLAIFAIVGARLRLLLHLFGDEMETKSSVFLPENDTERMMVVICSHIIYDNPTAIIMQVFPTFAFSALECLRRRADFESGNQSRSDFEGRLGTHLAFYYWNDCFSNQNVAEQILDRYFADASSLGRASMISSIGRIFEDAHATEGDGALLGRVMHLWERRFAEIERVVLADAGAYDRFSEELAAFTSWLDCKALPFEWRFKRVLGVLKLANSISRAHSLIDTIKEWAATEGRVDEAIVLLHVLVEKKSPEFRWEFLEGGLKSTIESGFRAENKYTRKLATEIQEQLLQQGFFDYLDLEVAVEKERIASPNL